MISILVNDICPILVIMLLGYLCGKFYFFDNDQRQGLNKLVLNIALPAALFISIVKATRKMFAQDIILTLISIFGVVGLFMLSYYLDKLFFHRTTPQAAVCALIAGSPTIGFLGFAVRFYLFGAVIIAVTDYPSPMAAGVPVMPDACARIFSMQFSFVFALWNCSAND